MVSTEQCRNRDITFTFPYVIADAKTIGSVKVKVILSGKMPV